MYRKRSGAVPERKDRACQEHWQILRALNARDGELAESLMRAHISRASDHLLAVHANACNGRGALNSNALLAEPLAAD